jgi:hypothetical protein
MKRESVLKMVCGVAAAVLFGLGTGLPTLARAEKSQWEETRPALRIQADTRRNRVWVLSLHGVFIYDSSTRKLLKRIELPNWTVVRKIFMCPPDLVLSPSGTALVTSNILPILWEIDAESLAVRQHNLVPDVDSDKDFGFTALYFDRGGRELLGASSPPGSVWRIDLSADKVHKVRLSSPVRGDCGLGLQY